MAGELEPRKETWIEHTRTYVEEIRNEMRRVTWPTRDQVQSTTLIVIICVFAFAAYFKIVDKIIEETVVRAYTALTR